MRGSLVGLLALVAGLGAFACGAGAEEGGGADNLPTRGAGPFERLPRDPETAMDEPIVLSDPDGQAAFYGPSVLREGDGTYTVYFTADDGVSAEIWRATGVDLDQKVLAFDVSLTADASWEAGGVHDPAVIRPGLSAAYGLFYAGANGGIGYAESDDGLAFTALDDEPLVAAELPGEGVALGQPTAAWVGDVLWLYYAAADTGAIFAATVEAGGGAGATVTKLDASELGGGHEPILGPNPLADSFDSERVAAPHLLVTNEAERWVFDLWYAGLSAEGRWSIGFAGSYDGLDYGRLPANPVFPGGAPFEQDPCALPAGVTTIMFFTDGTDDDRVIAVGTP